MRILVIILLISLISTFFVACGKAPTGETDYNQIRQEIQSGQNPPPEIPPPEEREKQESSGELGM